MSEGSEDITHFFREMVVKQETNKTIEKLEKNTHFSGQYYLMSILSSLIASIGILQGNLILFFIGISLSPYLVYLGYIVIGGFMKNLKLFLAGIKGFLGAFLLQTFFATLLGFFLVKFFPEIEVSSTNFLKFTDPGDLLNLLGTFLAGFTTLYCFLRLPKMEHFSGIGISFFLMPILVFIGNSLVIQDAASIISNSFILIINLTNLLLGASFAFMLFGFSLEKNER